MKDLKIKVNSEAESKEVQELFFELGAKWGHCGRDLANLDAIYFHTDCMEITCTDDYEIFVEWDGKETTIAELLDMVKPMKEYLNKTTYEYRLAHTKPNEDWVCIPEDAEALTTDDEGKGLIFWKDGFNFVVGLDDQWFEAVKNFKEFLLDYPKCFALWVRPTQPEALPFIDDNPQSLNDQYAEIEQVRQAGIKFDNGKPRHSLLPKGSISSVIAVLEFGAKKYEANNWQKVNNAKERYYDAAMRHIDSWWNGEKFDQETGIHHLAHAATNLFFLKWFDDKENNNG